MHVVPGVLKDYDWGVVDGLARWCGGPTGGPQAELWFGAHPSGASLIASGPDAGTTLYAIPEYAGLPMVKLLAASTPLSVQVHPDDARARDGWTAQQSEPREQWLYADDAEKSEMLVAITAFDVHAGWRDAAAAAEVLQRAGAPEAIVAEVRAGKHAEAVRLLLALDEPTCREIERQLVAAATAAGWSTAAVSALARVAATHPDDPGVLVSVLLDHVLLAPGEGMAVPAGVFHSYVVGLAVEVMTSSDNVLRLGLTSKPVAVEAAPKRQIAESRRIRIAREEAEVRYRALLEWMPRTRLFVTREVATALGCQPGQASRALDRACAEGRAKVWPNRGYAVEGYDPGPTVADRVVALLTHERMRNPEMRYLKVADIRRLLGCAHGDIHDAARRDVRLQSGGIGLVGLAGAA